MRLFRKLFAEKILRYYEGTEGGIRLIKSLPLVKKHLKEDAFGEKSKGRMAVGIISQLIMLLWEFIRKLLYVWQSPPQKARRTQAALCRPVRDLRHN